MSNKALTVSVIIPAYNEERHLMACLKAIAAQTVRPDEVIVVNNNSTDKTAKVANSYNFVRVVNEKIQGRTAARNTGFNSAKSDILSRIDADVIIAPDWVEKLRQAFIDDPELAATSGLSKSLVVPWLWKWTTTFWTRVYFWESQGYLGIPVVWGANMGLRRKHWLTIRSELCLDDEAVHEDQDVSFVLAEHGLITRGTPGLLVSIDGREYASGKFFEYFWRERKTKWYHKKRGTFKQVDFRRLPWPSRLKDIVFSIIPAIGFLLVIIFVMLDNLIRLFRKQPNNFKERY
ncbi:MAG: glycosyltransferase family 2 protein [Candidatus Saccharibacteria bacterium]